MAEETRGVEEDGEVCLSLFEGSQNLIFVLNEAGVILETNPATARVLQFDARELLGKNLFDFLTAGSWEELERTLAFFGQEQAEPCPAQVMLNTKAGTICCADLHVFAGKWRKRSVYFAVASIERTQEQYDRTLLNLLIQDIDDIIVVKDLSLRVRATNMAFVRASGHSSVEELIGKTDSEIFGVAPDSEPVRSYMEDERKAQMLPPGGAIVTEEPVVSPNGVVRTVLTRKLPLRDASGKVIGTGNISVDITDRKLLEQEVVKERNRYQQLFFLVPSAIVTLDNNKCVTSWNRMAEKITGYSAQEILGKPQATYALQGCDPYENGAMSQTMGHQPLMGYTCQLRRKDGEIISIRKNVAELIDPDSGETAGRIESFEDVTEHLRLERERREAQTQLIHSAKLASIGTLAGGIAHEINNPLAILVGSIRRLGDDFLPNERQKSLERINRAVERVVRLVKSLGIYARIDTETLEPVNLLALVSDTLSLVEPLWRNDSIAIEYSRPSDLPWVRGNQGKIEQVLMNLLTNARDALAGKEGERRIVIEASSEGKWDILKVLDNGSGIDPEILSRVFDPFFTTKPVGKGTGLGLSISQSIVSSLGGQILVASEAGKGTTFTVMLPICEQEIPRPVSEKSAIVRPKVEGTALVVEDEPALRELLTMELQDLGLQVREATDGLDAIPLLETYSFDYIFTDLKMPRMGGERLIEEVRHICGETTPWLIVVTGCVDVAAPERENESWQKTAHRILTKPFSSEDVARIILELRPSHREGTVKR